MIRVSKFNYGYFYAVGLAAAGMTLLTIPDLLKHGFFDPILNGITENRLLRNLQESLPPQEAEARISNHFDTNDLLSQLETADLEWQPKEEILEDGSTRYLYKRREGEPDLSVAELKTLVEQPPTFLKERKAILQLLQVLKKAGAKVVIAPTLKQGAAAEWDHSVGLLRIQPKMPQKGSVDFLKVLSHEAIHVAQSCKAGSLKSRPQALGIAVANKEDLLRKLRDPVYATASHWEIQLEMEAYAMQDDSSVAKQHVLNQCVTA